MGQQPADVPKGDVGQAGIPPLVVHQRVAVSPQRLVGVHTRAVVAVDRLGHERDRATVLAGHILHHVLVELHLVGHRQHLVEHHVDLGLPGGAHLVVLNLDGDAHRLEGHHHLRAEVLERVHGGQREIPALVWDAVAGAGRSAHRRATALEDALGRADLIAGPRRAGSGRPRCRR